jgi:hypothetical protein
MKKIKIIIKTVIQAHLQKILFISMGHHKIIYKTIFNMIHIQQI